jgi:serine/threonine protein kinase
VKRTPHSLAARQETKFLKSANPVPSGDDDTVATGVRETAARTAADAALLPDVAAALSGDDSQSLWTVEGDNESELPVPAGVLVDGKYSVERIFAAGGMGIVCLGRHVQLDQPVAIKFLRRSLSGRASIVQRFVNEARALAALRSEHVVRVMDVGQLESGRPYLVMEYLDGIHLDALLERDGALSAATAIRYVLQVCEALAEAHALGIVHRDVKPENLFLWSGGPNQDGVKVLDFGLAKQLGSSKALAVTGPQDSIGSPRYMSPEQITTPQLVDARTDIWSLGAVLYRLVTNKFPFDGDTLVMVLSHILNAVPVPLQDVVPGLDSELNDIILRCFEKAPDARYQSMSQLADALNAYVAKQQHRQQGSVDDEAPQSTSRVAHVKTAKIRIPGVHSRLPAGLAALAVLAALIMGGVYAADRSGRIKLRNLTDGWLTGPALAADAPTLELRSSNEQWHVPASGVYAITPVRDASGALTLRAVPERDLVAPTQNGSLAEQAAFVAAMEDQRTQRHIADLAHLKSQILTPASDTLPLPAEVPVAPSDVNSAVEPSDDPYQ